jgi:hypothetical protein
MKIISGRRLEDENLQCPVLRGQLPHEERLAPRRARVLARPGGPYKERGGDG